MIKNYPVCDEFEVSLETQSWFVCHRKLMSILLRFRIPVLFLDFFKFLDENDHKTSDIPSIHYNRVEESPPKKNRHHFTFYFKPFFQISTFQADLPECLRTGFYLVIVLMEHWVIQYYFIHWECLSYVSCKDPNNHFFFAIKTW